MKRELRMESVLTFISQACSPTNAMNLEHGAETVELALSIPFSSLLFYAMRLNADIKSR